MGNETKPKITTNNKNNNENYSYLNDINNFIHSERKSIKTIYNYNFKNNNDSFNINKLSNLKNECNSLNIIEMSLELYNCIYNNINNKTHNESMFQSITLNKKMNTNLFNNNLKYLNNNLNIKKGSFIINENKKIDSKKNKKIPIYNYDSKYKL